MCVCTCVYVYVCVCVCVCVMCAGVGVGDDQCMGNNKYYRCYITIAFQSGIL